MLLRLCPKNAITRGVSRKISAYLHYSSLPQWVVVLLVDSACVFGSRRLEIYDIFANFVIGNCSRFPRNRHNDNI